MKEQLKKSILISWLAILLLQLFLPFSSVVTIVHADNGVSFKYDDDERMRLTPTDIKEVDYKSAEPVGGEVIGASPGVWDWVFGFFRDVWDGITDWANNWDRDLPDWLSGLLKGIGVALIVIAGIAVLVFTGVIGIAVGIVAGVGALIAGALYGFFTGGDQFKFWEGLFSATVGALLGGFLYTSGALGAMGALFRQLFATPFSALWAELRFVGSYLWSGLAGAGRILASELGLAGRTFWGAITGAARMVSTGFGNSWQLIRSGTWSAIGSAFRAIGSGFANAGRFLATGIGNSLRIAWGGLSGAAQSLWGGLSSAGTAVWRGLISMKTAFQSGFSTIWTALRPSLALNGPITMGAFYSGLGTLMVEISKSLLGMQEWSFKNVAISVGLSLIPGAVFGKFMGVVGQLWSSKKWGQLLLWTVPISAASGLENVIGEYLKSGSTSFNDFFVAYITGTVVHGSGLFIFAPSAREYINVILGKHLEEIIKTGVGNISNWNDTTKDKDNYIKKGINAVRDAGNNLMIEFKYYYQRLVDQFVR
ncbi:phage tail tape measure protein [Brevibacillus migulae]|uniref:hypothetical protein n=1 Tax=Brevibacillus migulae TaxID=1644114 RepID=UPI00106E10B1|nr:hypothetical protein [Brevibacillus migulae]